MFTGIVQQCGMIESITFDDCGAKISIRSSYQSIKSGESIAVNGVCLTVLDDGDNSFRVDVSPETLDLTTIGTWRAKRQVNLERALRGDERFGGHFVLGHVDTKAVIEAINEKADFKEIIISEFQVPQANYLVKKGSIAVDGISLTINEAIDNRVSLMIVPHTLKYTNLSELAVGDSVNIEYDYLARIIAHQLATAPHSRGMR